MARLRTYGQRVRETLSYYVGGVYRQVYEKDIFLWAQAISFKVLIALVPVVILGTGVLGWVLRREDAFARVALLIRQYLPPGQGSQLVGFLERLQEAGTFYTTLGIVALVFSAMTLFTTLRVVISNIFQEPWHRQRTILGGYLFDLRMSAQVGLVFVLTFGLTVFFQSNVLGWLGLDYDWLVTTWRSALRWFALLVPYLLSIGMFFQLFYFVPQPHPPRRSALLGAVVTGLLWEVAKYGFAFYAASVGRFDRYNVPGGDGQEGFAALGNAFGLIIAFVFWAYYSGLVLCVGGLIAVLHEKRHRLRRLKQQAPALPEEAEAGEPPVEIVGETAIPAAGDANGAQNEPNVY